MPCGDVIPPAMAKLITKCWHTDYHKRPSCAEVKKMCALMRQDAVAGKVKLKDASADSHRARTV